jgi:alpha/beta superfamily hydrolase
MHKITSNVLYNARATWDCRQVVRWLRSTFPNRPLFGIGFSLGASILTNVSYDLEWWIGPTFNSSSILARRAQHACERQPLSVVIHRT